MAAEKVLWEEVCPEGKHDRVVTIAAYRNFNYGVKYITGLEFTYKSGTIYTIGSVRGERSREVHFGDNERISRLEVTSARYGIIDITVCDGRPNPSSSTLTLFRFASIAPKMEITQIFIH